MRQWPRWTAISKRYMVAPGAEPGHTSGMSLVKAGSSPLLSILVLPPPQVRLIVVGHAVRRGDELNRRAPWHAAIADPVSGTFFGCVGNSAGRGKDCATGLLEALNRSVDVDSVDAEVRNAEVAGSNRLGLFGAVHFKELDVRSGSDLDHGLRPHDRSRKSTSGPLEFGSLSRRVLRSEGLIDHLAAESFHQERFGCFDVGHRDA